MDASGTALSTEFAPLNRAATFTYPGITMPAFMTAAAAQRYSPPRPALGQPHIPVKQVPHFNVSR